MPEPGSSLFPSPRLHSQVDAWLQFLLDPPLHVSLVAHTLATASWVTDLKLQGPECDFKSKNPFSPPASKLSPCMSLAHTWATISRPPHGAPVHVAVSREPSTALAHQSGPMSPPCPQLLVVRCPATRCLRGLDWYREYVHRANTCLSSTHACIQTAAPSLQQEVLPRARALTL